jgi:hypothetical protein
MPETRTFKYLALAASQLLQGYQPVRSYKK